jgi:uncharacterized protein YecE (DUF72 family)
MPKALLMAVAEIFTGCSSIDNLNWEGVFFPADLPRNQYFEYYCEHFDTYELNSSFYKFPTARSLKNWYDKSPPHFTFAVKAPKLITHINQFRDCAKLLDEFYIAASKGMKDKLAAVLFQLPPKFKYDPAIFDMILKNLNPDFVNVIEFRNASWWIPEVYQALSDEDITFCGVSYPGLPDHYIETNGIGYFRLHGVPDLFYSEYTANYLRDLRQRINSTTKAKKTFVYFNNTASTAGILNAMYFELLSGNH